MIRRSTLICLFVLASHLPAQAPARSRATHLSEEAATSAAFERARAAGPLALHAFLEKMPKGADLHMHLSGAIYAETFLKDAVEDHLCVDPVRHAFVKGVSPTLCPDGDLPASAAFKDQQLYDALVDSFSMRSFVPTPGVSGHDQFFATFGNFSGIDKRHNAEWLDEVATRAARQNEQYLEVMMTPSFSKASALGRKIGWPTPLEPATTAATSLPAPPDGATRAQLAALRDKLLAGGLRDEVAADRDELDGALTTRRELEHCGRGPEESTACAVNIRIIYQILRANPPQQVFAQTLLAFEVASADPENVVGLNFVQPEDAYMAMSEYHRQMLMLDYLHSVYPKVHISLHAGELAPAVVPPAGLSFHIREAVELGHAERIGHGVDALYESPDLLNLLAIGHVMVEINLTSNDVILGITAPNHPLPQYMAAHVPVALSTDDEGVSRIDLTHEYVRAALEYHLTYAQLKQMARTSLEHAFLPGPSLWKAPDVFTAKAAGCPVDYVDRDHLTAPCRALLDSSPKATQQWILESRFHTFESQP